MKLLIVLLFVGINYCFSETIRGQDPYLNEQDFKYEIETKISSNSVKQTGRISAKFSSGFISKSFFEKNILPNDNGVELVPGNVFILTTSFPTKLNEISNIKLQFDKTGMDEGNEVNVEYIKVVPLSERDSKSNLLPEKIFKPKEVLKHGILTSTKQVKRQLEVEIVAKISENSNVAPGLIQANFITGFLANHYNKVPINLLDKSIRPGQEFTLKTFIDVYVDKIPYVDVTLNGEHYEDFYLEYITVNPIYLMDSEGNPAESATFKQLALNNNIDGLNPLIGKYVKQ